MPIDRTSLVVGTVPSPRPPSDPASDPPSDPPLPPWTPTPPSGIRWLDATPQTPPPESPSPESPSAPPVPTRPRRRWVVAGVVAPLVVIALVVGAFAATANRTMTVQGTVTVAGTSTILPGAPCSASALTDRSVSIFGADGLLVGTAPLSTAGVAIDRWGSSFPFADACRYTFLLTDVPASDRLYRVGVGGGIAGSVGFTREQLETTGAALTFGR